MAKIDLTFSDMYGKILNEGKPYVNKNRKVERLQIPAYTFRHDFDRGFPAITTKKLQFKSVVGELIWFLRGDNDIEYLNKNGIGIWNKDAYNWYKANGGSQSFEEFEAIGKGSTGQNYSIQWRQYNGVTDQIKDLIDNMKKDIMSSRLKVNAWNPSEVNQTPIPPCPSEFQVIGVPMRNNQFGFELHWNQRSTDAFLGAPFDVASFGLLAKVLERLTGYKALAIEGSLKCVHLYENAYEATDVLLKRDELRHKHSELYFDEFIDWKKMYEDYGPDKTFEMLQIDNFRLTDYTSYPAINVEMLAHK